MENSVGLDFSLLANVFKWGQKISRSSRYEAILLNLLKIEVLTNISILEKIPESTGRRTKGRRTEEDDDPPIILSGNDIAKIFDSLIETKVLLTLLTLVGEGEGLRKRISSKDHERTFENIAVSVIRKHRTLKALSNIDHRSLRKIDYHQRIRNLKKDFTDLQKMIRKVPPVRWYQKILLIAGLGS